MKTLIKQSSTKPTRKVLAVIVSGAVIGGVQAFLSTFWPDHPFAPVMENLDSWVQFAVMAAAGYLTHEAA